jgi:hypothetical protein
MRENLITHIGNSLWGYELKKKCGVPSYDTEHAAGVMRKGISGINLQFGNFFSPWGDLLSSYASSCQLF